MAQEQDPNQPKVITQEDLNSALASQKRDFERLLKQSAEQNKALIESLQSTLGPKPEPAQPSSRLELSEDAAELKKQVKILMDTMSKQEAQTKQLKLETTLRDTLGKHGISSRSDLAVKYLQDQVSYDEDGQIVMKMEIAPGVIQPLPLGEAVSKFAQTDHGKFLADPRDVRGSGSGPTSSPRNGTGTRTPTAQITNQGDTPIFKTAKEMKDYYANGLSTKLPF